MRIFGGTAVSMVVTVLGAPLLTGCVTEGPPPRPRPEPRTIPEPPGLQPALLLLHANPFPTDADGNGFADTLTVSVFLFPPENEFPIPIHADGVFAFTLRDDEERLLAEWEFEGERVERAKVRPLTGPGYIFDLDINEVATDRIGVNNVALRAQWKGPAGNLVEVRGPTIVREGGAGVGR